MADPCPTCGALPCDQVTEPTLAAEEVEEVARDLATAEAKLRVPAKIAILSWAEKRALRAELDRLRARKVTDDNQG